MHMQEIRNIAKTLGVKTAKQSKLNLIRAIQTAEGNFNCFGTAVDGVCDQIQCIWREDCFVAVKKKAN